MLVLGFMPSETMQTKIDFKLENYARIMKIDFRVRNYARIIKIDINLQRQPIQAEVQNIILSHL